MFPLSIVMHMFLGASAHCWEKFRDKNSLQLFILFSSTAKIHESDGTLHNLESYSCFKYLMLDSVSSCGVDLKVSRELKVKLKLVNSTF